MAKRAKRRRARSGRKARGGAGTPESVRAAVAHGRKQAQTVIELRRKSARTKAASVNGLLVAEGDSWFDYPFHDVLERLETQHGFRVQSVAHKGDTVEAMAYDTTQLARLARMFEQIAEDEKVPRAILLSGGGNDIAGDEFAVLLNHAASGLEVLNDNVVTGIIDERVRFALVSVISAVTALSNEYFHKPVPVVIHGYGYPVPDGRGYLGGFWILPGPWLEPGFLQKGYLNASGTGVDLPRCTEILEGLIDRFNTMLQTIPGQPGLGHVTYLNLRPVLSNALPGYKQSWENELHPTKSGFEAVAQEFRNVILTFPKPL
jgi:lysophospholipase L1-like esterase